MSENATNTEATSAADSKIDSAGAGPLATDHAEGGATGAQTEQTLLAKAGGEKNEGSGKSDTKKQPQGFLAKLFGGAGGSESVACTCGRDGSGKQGRHAADCPRSKNYSGTTAKHFGAPDLSKPAVAQATNAAVVVPLPVAPMDFSFWGRLTKTVVRTWLGFKARKIKKRCEGIPPLVEEAEPLSLEIKNAIPDKELESFAESAVKCAEHYNLQARHAPLADFLIQGTNIYGYVAAAESRIMAKLNNIEALFKQSQKPELKKAA